MIPVEKLGRARPSPTTRTRRPTRSRRPTTTAARCTRGRSASRGEPYFSHPVAVAMLLAEQQLDDATIITALLHDAVEDTRATYADIEGRFGEEVAQLVDGVTKLTNLELCSVEQRPGGELPQALDGDVGRICGCCWSSSPTGCTTCAPSATCPRRSRCARRGGPGHPRLCEGPTLVPKGHRWRFDKRDEQCRHVVFARHRCAPRPCECRGVVQAVCDARQRPGHVRLRRDGGQGNGHLP